MPLADGDAVYPQMNWQAASSNPLIRFVCLFITLYTRQRFCQRSFDILEGQGELQQPTYLNTD
jgi:hypothetical protein